MSLILPTSMHVRGNCWYDDLCCSPGICWWRLRTYAISIEHCQVDDEHWTRHMDTYFFSSCIVPSCLVSNECLIVLMLAFHVWARPCYCRLSSLTDCPNKPIVGQLLYPISYWSFSLSRFLGSLIVLAWAISHVELLIYTGCYRM